MNKRASLSILLMLSLSATVFGQGQTPAPAASTAPPPQQQPQTAAAPEDDDSDVVRISSNLVQVDAVVTDQKGNQVTDLTAEDFEILEDNDKQKITNFSYVSNETAPAPPVATAARDKNAPPVPPVRLRPEQVRRTIALVVDDLGLSFESSHFVRRALKKFVDEQMQPTDLVAIIRTGSGMGALQQFTSDKRQLYAAIERVRWNPNGRAGITAFAPITGNLADQELNSMDEDSSSGTAKVSGGILSDRSDQFREELFTVGTLGALNYIIRGLKELPGRKSILLISDGFALVSNLNPSGGGSNSTNQGIGRYDRVIESLRRLIDLANRASVVIYSMDPRGLQTLGISAEDNLSDMSSAQIETALANRRSEFFESQNGPDYLARQTGGFAIRNSNDLSGGVRRVLDDQRGYYLIGYRPDESTFDPKTGSRRFHNLTVKVKRPGLRVRTRNGFYGVENREARAVPRTRVDQLVAALTSPFNSNGIDLRLTSLFGYDQKSGSFIRSLLHIDGRDLTFTKEADGWNKSILDVLVITFGDNGTIIDQVSKTYTLRMNKEVYERALRHGFNYTVNLPVKKSGAYQLRVALRDSASERVGSASQFIEVPNVGKDRLMLSGIVMSGSTEAAIKKQAPAAPPAAPAAASAANTDAQGADETGDTTDPDANPVVRRFKRGMVLEFNYLIFNARLDKASMRPQVQTQVRVFREGKPIFTGNPKPFDVSNQTDPRRLVAGGALLLGAEMTPGEYVLQIVVTDFLAKDKNRTATQWMDFEITQ
jgi:VWFA-related protein